MRTPKECVRVKQKSHGIYSSKSSRGSSKSSDISTNPTALPNLGYGRLLGSRMIWGKGTLFRCCLTNQHCNNVPLPKEKPAAWNAGDKASLKSKLIFQEFRHGTTRKRKRNTITVEQEAGGKWEFDDPIITLGRSAANHVVLQEMSVSRRHCAIVNYPEDVWLYDLASTHGTYVDGNQVENLLFLEGRCRVSIGDRELTVLPKEGILL